jgi:hypothetical protein
MPPKKEEKKHLQMGLPINTLNYANVGPNVEQKKHSIARMTFTAEHSEMKEICFHLQMALPTLSYLQRSKCKTATLNHLCTALKGIFLHMSTQRNNW